MCQERVYRLLKRSKKPLRTKDIMRKLNLGSSSVGNSLKILTKHKEIKFAYKLIKGKDGNAYFIRYYFT